MLRRLSPHLVVPGCGDGQTSYFIANDVLPGDFGIGDTSEGDVEDTAANEAGDGDTDRADTDCAEDEACQGVENCGDGVIDSGEACDSSNFACRANEFCSDDCACDEFACGDDSRDGTAACAGFDDAACGVDGACSAFCECVTFECGNNSREGTEECDSIGDSGCTGGDVCLPAYECGSVAAAPVLDPLLGDLMSVVDFISTEAAGTPTCSGTLVCSRTTSRLVGRCETGSTRPPSLMDINDAGKEVGSPFCGPEFSEFLGWAVNGTTSNAVVGCTLRAAEFGTNPFELSTVPFGRGPFGQTMVVCSSVAPVDEAGRTSVTRSFTL